MNPPANNADSNDTTEQGESIAVRVFNAAGGCVSWRACEPGQEDAAMAELKALFKGPDFVFKVTEGIPDIPKGGYTQTEAEARRIRFTKNVT